MGWTVLIPVKRLSAAKSRLRGAAVAVDHTELVLALLLDTLASAQASAEVDRVVVVTSDAAARDAATAAGAGVIADVPDAGLNEALAYAATVVRAGGDREVGHNFPIFHGGESVQAGIAALSADLPALRPTELTEALRHAGVIGRTRAASSFVADAAGTGTVLLAAPPGTAFEPHFGSGSAAVHAAAGAIPLPGGWPGLRRDVDTPADLSEASGLGLGPRTSRAVAAGGAPPGWLASRRGAG